MAMTMAVVVLSLLVLSAIVRGTRHLRAARRRRLLELPARGEGELNLARFRGRARPPIAEETQDRVDFIAELRATGRALAEFIESRPPAIRASALRIVTGMAENGEWADTDPTGHAAYVIARAALEAVGDRRPNAPLRLVGEED